MPFQKPLPAEITRLSQHETDARISTARRCLGEDVMILGHHYQRDEIIKWADYRGDSLKLARIAGNQPNVPFIVLCGVHFMAESADILTGPHQSVILPNMNAGCSMADMATIRQVESCWRDLSSVTDTSRVVPITYVNSTAALKAFVGRNGGSCCTSSNAEAVVRWALDNGDKLLFVPDQHLGRNTAVKLGLDPDRDMALWDPHQPMGGLTPEEICGARVLLWKGHCSVHGRFTVEQIEQVRRERPGVTVVVHPECPLDVVQAADASGSTEFIIKMIEESEPGSSWAVGTEINLVNRLSTEHPDTQITCLDPVVCPCSTMYRIHPHFLLWSLEALERGEVVNPIRVPADTAAEARLALNRMLTIG